EWPTDENADQCCGAGQALHEQRHAQLAVHRGNDVADDAQDVAVDEHAPHGDGGDLDQKAPFTSRVIHARPDEIRAWCGYRHFSPSWWTTQPPAHDAIGKFQRRNADLEVDRKIRAICSSLNTVRIGRHAPARRSHEVKELRNWRAR